MRRYFWQCKDHPLRNWANHREAEASTSRHSKTYVSAPRQSSADGARTARGASSIRFDVRKALWYEQRPCATACRLPRSYQRRAQRRAPRVRRARSRARRESAPRVRAAPSRPSTAAARTRLATARRGAARESPECGVGHGEGAACREVRVAAPDVCEQVRTRAAKAKGLQRSHRCRGKTL
eukprot:6192232-Pleurochrysis_carterae.AAC.1